MFIWDTRRSGRFGCLASLDSTKTMWNSSSSSDDCSQRPKKRIRQTLEMLNVPIGNHMTGKAHRGPVDSITFTPDGNYLVSVRGIRETFSLNHQRLNTNTGTQRYVRLDDCMEHEKLHQHIGEFWSLVQFESSSTW